MKKLEVYKPEEACNGISETAEHSKATQREQTGLWFIGLNWVPRRSGRKEVRVVSAHSA